MTDNHYIYTQSRKYWKEYQDALKNGANEEGALDDLLEKLQRLNPTDNIAQPVKKYEIEELFDGRMING